MRDAADEAGEPAVAEDRRRDRQVGQMAGAEPGIVGDEDVARVQALGRAGRAARCLVVIGSVMVKAGVESCDCAIERPRLSIITTPKSRLSPTIVEKEVRATAASTSSMIVISRVHRISRSIGIERSGSLPDRSPAPHRPEHTQEVAAEDLGDVARREAALAIASTTPRIWP